MIFSDEPRFQKNAIAHPTNRQIHGFAKAETEKHVGPGVYFSNSEEDRRNGWSKKSFSTREPMSPVKVSRSPGQDRHEYYTAGVVNAYGAVAAPVSPTKRNNPGPGHYDGDIFNSFSPSPLKRAQSAQSMLSFKPNSTMNNQDRFAHSPSLCMKDGIIFQSRENSQPTVGPGHYPVQRNDFLKKSHNIRVKNASSPNKTQPIVDVRQVFGAPGSTFKTPEKVRRPKSASNSPMNVSTRSGGSFE